MSKLPRRKKVTYKKSMTLSATKDWPTLKGPVHRADTFRYLGEYIIGRNERRGDKRGRVGLLNSRRAGL